MTQKWPVKKAITCYTEKPRPFRLLETGVRTIDTANPIVEGGTGFIPGPFGTGKTVLQHAISKQADADIVIMAACGERANEVVEIFVEFPELEDPHTGRKLMERTIIIANTSNMYPLEDRWICQHNFDVGMASVSRWRRIGLRIAKRRFDCPRNCQNDIICHFCHIGHLYLPVEPSGTQYFSQYRRRHLGYV